jgi:hypothetical protein
MMDDDKIEAITAPEEPVKAKNRRIVAVFSCD